MRDTKSYVDSLFSVYEDVKNLADFKEELTGHLNEKIEGLVKKGLSADEAFQKAAEELGDISALADGMNLQRKQEIISEAFMDIRRFMNPRRVAAYTFCGLLLAFGAICAALVFFADGIPGVLSGAIPAGTFTGNSKLLGLFGALLAFVPAGIAGFTFLLLTQESQSSYPMPVKRALWYTAAALVLSGGLILLPITWFAVEGKENTLAAIGVLIPFGLPSAGLLVFLALTEKDRKKPWIKQLREKELAFFADPSTQLRFGMFSGAIWISAIALCILLGFIVSFKISWIVFLFATAAQLCIQGKMMKDSQKDAQNEGN